MCGPITVALEDDEDEPRSQPRVEIRRQLYGLEPPHCLEPLHGLEPHGLEPQGLEPLPPSGESNDSAPYQFDDSVGADPWDMFSETARP